MAAGPPKKPVGLLKKSNVAERAEQQATEAAANNQTQSKTETAVESQEESTAKAMANLADIIKQSVPKSGDS